MKNGMSHDQMKQCIMDCAQCSAACAQCSHHCLGMGGEHASQDHQGIMRDCAEICALAVCFMARESRHAPHLCAQCAEICEACAESCEGLSEGDQVMTRCAEMCRRRAESCRAMSGSTTSRGR